MSQWTADRVAALAPDPASASAGQSLASAKKWTGLGQSPRAIWGLCQGSGRTPYQTRVDLAEPAFKCGCPSRKFPCKHGVGLLLLYAKDGSVFPAADEPDWVSEWMTGRAEKARKKTEHVTGTVDKPVDVESQARRAAQREARVRDGVASCRLWLEDLVRRGLAAAQADATEEWERTAARLVDAQATGLASFVRRISGSMVSGPGWDARTLDLLGQLHLLLCAAEQLERLPLDLAGDVRTALGWTQSREAALNGEGVHDRWTAVGQVIEEDERFTTARTWLVGHASGRRALILEFAAGGAPLDRSIAAGITFDGVLQFYPGRQPLRAIVASRSAPDPARSVHGPAMDETVDAGLRRYAEALAANPWLVRWPLVLAQTRLVREDDRWFLADNHDRGLPLRDRFVRGLQLWRLAAATEGRPASVVAEWNGASAQPIAVMTGSGAGFLDLSPRWAA